MAGCQYTLAVSRPLEQPGGFSAGASSQGSQITRSAGLHPLSLTGEAAADNPLARFTTRVEGVRQGRAAEVTRRPDPPGMVEPASGRDLVPLTRSGRKDSGQLSQEERVLRNLTLGRHGLVLTRCGCRSWFCSECCVGRGLKVRERLTPILESGEWLFVTLTVDPTLGTPEALYRHVREVRAIGELVRALDKEGSLLSRRYAVFLEWQEDTEQAHYHLLVNARFIDKGRLAELWGRFRPAWAGPVQRFTEGKQAGQLRPTFGFVDVDRMDTAERAASYVTKYLTKVPKQGFPQWVLDFKGGVKRYWVSKGFWGESVPRQSPRVREEPKERTETIRERLSKCGSTSSLFEVQEWHDETGQLVRRQWKYLRPVHCRLEEAADRLGVDLGGGSKFWLRGCGELFQVTRRKRRQRVETPDFSENSGCPTEHKKHQWSGVH